MTTATPAYSASVALTWTIASKASDTNLLAGFESTAVDNKDTDDAIDSLIGGKWTTGTSPTASRQIETYLHGSYDDTEFGASAAGTDGALTVTAESKTLLELLRIIPTHSTSNTAYKLGPRSAAMRFDGFLPVQWGGWFVHNGGVNLNSTAGNHEAVYFPVKMESA